MRNTNFVKFVVRHIRGNIWKTFDFKNVCHALGNLVIEDLSEASAQTLRIGYTNNVSAMLDKKKQHTCLNLT